MRYNDYVIKKEGDNMDKVLKHINEAIANLQDAKALINEMVEQENKEATTMGQEYAEILRLSDELTEFINDTK